MPQSEDGSAPRPTRPSSVPLHAARAPQAPEAVQAWLVARLSERLGIEPDDIDVRDPFATLGLSSREAVALSGELEEWLGRRLSPTLVYDYPNIAALASHLADSSEPAPSTSPVEPGPGTETEPIAIIGIGCRFPGARDPKALWRLLRDGIDAITQVPADRWDLGAFYDPNPAAPGKMNTRWGGFLERIDQFDHDFFAISPREASRMDPQQRLLLEVAWEAIEDGGHATEHLAGTRTGVFIGISTNDYGRLQLGDPELIDAYAGTGNAFSIAANRLSYVFDFRGPSIAVDTACSSSLVAVHLACCSLWSGESTLALAGGVNLILSPAITINFTKAGAMAPDGRCKAFDARADGYVRGEGAGVVLLKPLSRALADEDPIYAVIRGSAVNQDGRTNGLMAPSRQAQEAVLLEAYRRARVSPGQVQYVEAHGTGTLLGDPIEAKALGMVLGQGRAPEHPCLLGSIKTNIGHVEAAAGIAGLIKTALALKHRLIPASLHFQEPNPHIPFDELPLRVQKTLAPWPDEARPALAGVSSFGFGGTNAHVVLEEPPELPDARERERTSTFSDPSRACLLPLSARGPEALRSLASSYRDWIAEEAASDTAVPDIAYTASVRRSHHDYRTAFVTQTREELRDHLEAFLQGDVRPGMSSGRRAPSRRRRLVFVFSGQGSQWAGMGRELLQQEPVFRAALERCDQAIRGYADWSVLEALAIGDESLALGQIDVVQPTLFAIQVALTALWRSWGLEPDSVVGHSMGEVAAAHAAGALRLEDAVRIICRRSRLLRRVSGQGGMAAVELPVEQALAALDGYEDRLSIAVSNSPTSTVLSGELAALHELLDKLQHQGVFSRLVKVDVASHSPQVDPLRAELLEGFEELQPRAPSLPFYSTVEGRAANGLPLDAAYWWRNLREPVQFWQTIRELVAGGHDDFVEISPHPILSPAIQQGLHHLRHEGAVLPSLRREHGDRAAMLGSLGALYTLGYAVEWRELYRGGGRCVRLPSYPWQRERCWVETEPAESGFDQTRSRKRRADVGTHPLLQRHFSPADAPANHYWESELDPGLLPYLHDHRIQGVAVLASSAYLEMALAAVEAIAEGPRTLKEVRFHRAFFLPERGAPRVQLTITPGAAGTASFHVYSHDGRLGQAGEPWVLHATGQVSHLGIDGSSQVAIDALRARCGREVPGEDYYLELAQRGVQYGPALQAIARLWCGDNEALGELEVPAGQEAHIDTYRLHPALLDACLQVLGAAAPVDAGPDGNSSVHMLTSIDQVRLHHRPGARLWSHAQLRERNVSGLTGDVRLLDETGQVVLEALGVRLERLHQRAPRVASARLDDWLYEVAWLPKERPSAEVAAGQGAQSTRGSWLIFADRSDVGKALSGFLRMRGERCVLVSPGETCKRTYKRADREHFQIPPGRPEDMRRLLAATLGRDQPPLRGVVHLWGLDAVPPAQATAATLETAQRLGCGSALHLLQEMARSQWDVPPRLWIVTRGSQPAGGQPSTLAVAQAPLWGLGRVIAQEHPVIWGGLVDLDPDTSARDAAAVLGEQLWGPDGEDQIAFRRGQRYVARLSRSRASAKRGLLRWRPDGTYLITGGLGDLGLEVARWMVEQGARRLILMGRTKLPPRAQWNHAGNGGRIDRQIAAVRSLEALGASVHLAAVDVADAGHLTSFLEVFRGEGWPPIRGVVHAAGLASGRTLLQLDLHTLNEVLRPKVTGSWLLHRLLGDDQLDFFVLFSSAASLLGILGQGQGNYAAANAFMDALAHHRQAEGQSAVSINWGPWSDVGLAARDERLARLAERGIGSLAPRQALEVLGRVLDTGSAQVAVMPVNWSRVRRSFPTASATPILSSLADEASEDSSLPSGTGQARLSRNTLLAAEPGTRQRLLEAYLTNQVARVLGFSPAKLDVQQSLNRLGLDSMMAVELKNRIEVDLELTVPMVRFLEGIGVAEMTLLILAELSKARLTDPRPGEQDSPPASPWRKTEPAESSSFFPLSYSQHVMWLQCQVAPESTAYSVPVAVHIRSELNVPALRRACQALVDRHSVLRSTYAVRDGQPVQQVHAQVEASFHEHDASAWSDAHLEKRLDEELHRPFDLEHGPVLRVNVFARTPTEHLFLLTVHHIAIDFWSLEILIDELRTLYAGESAGTPTSLPQPGAAYPDFVAWQATMLAGPEGERLWTYWQRQLAGELPIVELPTDRPRPALRTYRGATHFSRLHDELVRQLRALASTEQTTLYATLAAALQVLLCRYTGQEDILVGVPTVGRSRPEFESVVGCFVEGVALRGDLSGNPSFRTLLGRVRQAMLGALAHQYYPIALLAERLKVPRDPSRPPLIQVMFGWDRPRRLEQHPHLPGAPETERDWLPLEGLAQASFSLNHRIALFDLLLIGIEARGSVSVAMQYNTDLFDDATIVRTARHLQTLLRGIVADPDRRIIELPLLTEAERQQLVTTWNDTRVDYPRDVCLHELIEAQVERTPDATAVVFDAEQLTYGELNQRANQVAHLLRTLGVGPDVLVGICVDRSLEMIVGLLAILKAGGAYVPLDPTHPPERLLTMTTDSHLPVVLTQRHLVDKLPAAGAHVICLDGDLKREAQHDVTNLPRVATPDNLAYVLYTSGSTGKPKGVMIPHRGICNRLLWMQDAYRLSAADRVLQKTPFTFDVSVWEFFWPLMAGARLVVARPGGHQDGAYLVGLIAAQQITTIHFVPSMLEVFLEQPGLEGCQSLRLVICSGEALPLDLQERCLGQLSAALHNLYGPTEASVDVTFWACERGGARHSVPIGRPIANTQTYVLDANLEPVPIGVSGDLHLGGVGLARGYLGRPGLTAEKFIPDPFSTEPGARLYKTGDLARHRPDGSLEFLGRSDHQVKLRGFRVELAEIEAILGQHPAVREAVVLVREDMPGDKRLVAYVVPNTGHAPTIGDLRTFLKPKLPDYMVPAAFVVLQALPLTSHGKLDRRALPVPDTGRPELEQAFVAPQTPTEEMLAAVWTEVLGLKRVGIHDSFFDLGGHSLLATQVVSRVRDAFQVELPLSTFFEAPTVAELAKAVEGASRIEPHLQAPPVRPVSRDLVLPLSFVQQRFWFLDRLEPGNPAYNIPTAIRLTGRLDVTALRQSLNEVVRRHEVLRTTFGLAAGRPVQVIARELTLPMPVVDLGAIPESERETEVRRLATAEVQRAFDLARGPLLWTTLLRLDEHEHVWVLVMHHIISDGWSMGVLIREMVALYEAFCNGKPSPLPELPIQYADFAHWQQEWSAGETLASHLSYWKEQLGGCLPVLELPSDRVRPPIQTSRGTTTAFRLPTALSESLRELSRREGVTLFMVLLAAFKVLLHRYTQQADIIVGTPIANRTRVEVEGLIGAFLNTLALRTDLSGNPSFRELLRRVRSVTLEAYAHQALPFEKLVEELRPNRDLSRTPIFQVMFVLQNAPIPVVELSGLTLQPLEVDTGTAPFDLSLFIAEIEQGLVAAFSYNLDLFEAGTIARLRDHFLVLLEGIVASPQQDISDLPVLSDVERDSLLMEGNDTRAHYPAHARLHQLFEAQVERTPNALAVVAANQELTYRALNQRANQLAHHLRSLGVRSEVPVALCTERSLSMAVGLLGILKAGGAFVPLDPAYPRERLAFMLADAGTPVLVTQERLRDGLPTRGLQVVCVDTGWERIAQAQDSDPIGEVTAENLAYVIYTSGSTGRPKGVMIPHRAVVNHNIAVAQRFGLHANDRVLQFHSMSFDAAIEELFPSWSVGATVVLRGEAVPVPGPELHRLIELEHLTVLYLPTAYWHEWVDELLRAPAAVPTSLRLVVVGGEKAGTDRLVTWQRLIGGRIGWINSYGPTEATVTATVHEPSRGATDQREGSGVRIGRPIANTQVYVLDARLQPVPTGVSGELHIGGAGLARGYLRRGELTAERFIPNPFGQEPGARLYKTGDIARYRADGTLEFLGRRDGQVKVRGFRVELGEIEAALDHHPAIRRSVVVAREESPGDQHLVAYVVSDQESAPTVSDLRGFLRAKLPDHMVPAVFVVLQALPLTPSGKIDHGALLALGGRAAPPEKVLVNPRDDLELQLVQIWEGVLNIRPIGVTDNFFELGGHSLLAVRLMARIRDLCGRDLPLTTLFRGPTIGQLAGILRRQVDPQPRSPLVAVQPVGSRRPFFCVHPSGGTVLCYYNLAHHLDLERPFYGFEARGLQGSDEPHGDVQAMATEYVAALQAAQADGPYLLGGWSTGGVVAWEIAQQLLARGQDVALLALFDAWAVPPGEGLAFEAEPALLERFARDLGLRLDHSSVSLEHLLRVHQNEQLLQILEQARAAKLLPDEVGLDELRRYFTVFQMNLRAMRSYAPRRYPGRVALFVASEQLVRGSHDPTMGWGELAVDGLETYVVPGNHYTMFEEPHVQVLADRLRECIRRVEPGG